MSEVPESPDWLNGIGVFYTNEEYSKMLARHNDKLADLRAKLMQAERERDKLQAERDAALARVKELEARPPCRVFNCGECEIAKGLQSQLTTYETALAALPLVEGGEFTVGSLDPDTDTYPVYMKVGCTQCGSIAEFYSQERAQGYINLLTLWQRMGR